MKVKNCYRIIRDEYCGFEAQVKYWWFPFCWFQMTAITHGINTWYTIEEAKDFIENGISEKYKKIAEDRKRKNIVWKEEGCK